MPGQTADKWYALHTRSNFEKRIVTELSAKGIENFLPCYDEVHQWKDRKQKVSVPLFPGYVFSRLDESSGARLSVLRTAGVVRILGDSGGIEPVPDEQIEAIRILLRSKLPCLAYPFLREGCWVRVRRGPLAGVEGILVRAKGEARLVISVSMLSQSVAVEVDSCNVEPVMRADSKDKRA